MIFLDLSADFDSIDHAIFLSRLKSSFGFNGLVYNRIESYLSPSFQTVMIGNYSSTPTHLATGVPQCSVLGSLLFRIYTTPIASLACSYSVSEQQYADDTQPYISLSLSHHSSLFPLVLGNVLMLSGRCFGQCDGLVVPLTDHVKLLDNRLSMDKHVNEVRRACFLSSKCIEIYSTSNHCRRRQ